METILSMAMDGKQKHHVVMTTDELNDAIRIMEKHTKGSGNVVSNLLFRFRRAL